MDILLTVCFIGSCIFLGWSLCLLYFTILSKKKKNNKIDLSSEIMIESIIPNGNVANAINNARKSMRL